jgi:hypothetical protein
VLLFVLLRLLLLVLEFLDGLLELESLEELLVL